MTLKELTEEYNALRKIAENGAGGGMEGLEGVAQAEDRRAAGRPGQGLPGSGSSSGRSSRPSTGRPAEAAPTKRFWPGSGGAFPAARTSIKCVRWYAKDLRRRGRTLPDRPRSRRGGAVRVEIAKGGKRGAVVYDEAARTVRVEFDGPRADAELHLTAPRRFLVPESARTDDFRTDTARPTDNRTYMELALCTLHAETGFWVDWDTLED